ncbi:hypothetical protein SAMN04488107_0068 [Geodermatophilus saharensis]|uniref:site-specific DNA-methyltransferase (adenine-specific) n=1 Tax=Geodermatophilus saharensis TaxID=1137994 RepID=A0A238ZGR9_9ACTN|nr:hypothetical protein [Geodermatophilus saharensis]SNR82460.1 hypothetical protein SAMN04488107_0068 [Geodermatophilus saharensis]
MTWYDAFLTELEPITWRPKPGDGLPASIEAGQVFVQATQYGLEVAVASAGSRPTSADMRKTWKARQANRPSPVLLAVGYPGRGGTLVAVCGPVGDEPPVTHDLEPSRVERLAAAALAEPSRHAAARCLLRLLPEVESDLPGIINSGLLATQEIRGGVPQRSDWSAATTTGRASLKRRGRDLIKALGFAVDQLGANTSVLTAGRDRRAIAVFLDEGETFEVPVPRFDGVSPVAHALAVADREHLSWVVMTRASEIRLYAARPDTGVGRKGRTETFVEVNLALLPDDRAGYLHLLFSADALAPAGTLEQILASSADFAADLAYRLRDRVYREAVPVLARAVAQRLDPDPDEETLAQAYDQTLNILFRLLFVAYGEDKGLLPYNSNNRYRDHSLKRLARLVSDDINDGRLVYDARQTDLWDDVVQIWEAIHRGNRGWGVPAYNGGLFSSAPEVNAAGAALAKLRLDNSEFGPALTALLVDTGDADVVGPVDFRSLSVREFGTIYEGLLESALSVAPADLAVDAKGNYVPARAHEHVEVPAGAVYLHNQSGARKATGSYFTKPFAVEHLLDHALEPALDEHLARITQHLDAGDEAAAASAFFDFRCADIAMGSAHFLVAAVDRIEARLSAFLALNPIPAVTAELETLATAAYEALGELKDGVEIETTSLLRRQVGRRCIYGVDRNPIAVELARLAIWIHTFVPGLPLSFLDHNLTVGDSLTGIATVDEALAELTGGGTDAPQTLFHDRIVEFLARASKALRRLGTISDATVADVKEARQVHLEAIDQVKPATALFDLLVAHRLGKAAVPVDADEDTVTRAAAVTNAAAVAAGAHALHFPVAFPEVFLRDRPGFDCLLGNPPWEEATVEELGFWAVRFPGLKSLTAAQQKAEIKRLRAARPDLVAEYDAALADAELTRALLVRGPYPGMGTGDPDLYKAFAWRFWQTLRTGGAIGIVLPRSALAAKGSTPWRQTVLSEGAFADTTMLLNTGGWVFDDAEHRYTIGLVTIRRGAQHAGEVALRGPFSSLQRFLDGVQLPPASFPVEEFLGWSDGAAFPLLPSPEAVTVFQKLRAHPRLDAPRQDWRARPATEFHATNDKPFLILDENDANDDAWPVFKGASFNVWAPDTGTYYAWADPEVVTKELQRRRVRGQRSARSAFSEFTADWAKDRDTLPCWYPRIAFRDIARATDSRTLITCLIRGELVLTNQAPYVLWPKGDERDEAFLLGVLSSMPLDWYARRVVETHVNFHVFNGLPIPDPGHDDRHRRRVEEVAGRLAAVDDWYTDWAEAVGVPVGRVTPEERPELLAELDAAVAHLYGLGTDDLRVIYGTFHEGADYSAHRDRVLAHHEKLA